MTESNACKYRGSEEDFAKIILANFITDNPPRCCLCERLAEDPAARSLGIIFCIYRNKSEENCPVAIPTPR